tara:strand:+ start:1480 stop:2241 length:762 start_codon:yes stop_codon:yes gene_type:complete
MADSIDRYQVYCLEEAKFVETLSETEPTECPSNVNHTSRAINPALTSIIETFYKNTIKAEENSEGYFETTHITMEIPSGTPGDLTEHDVSWPMNILLWRTLITPTTDMLGDVMSVIGSPETTIGALTSSVAIGDTTFNVNSTVTDNISRGFLINIFDGVNKDFLGRCIAVDKLGGTISVETGTVNAFAPGSAIQIGVFTLKDIYLADTSTIDIGTKGFKGKTLTAGMILRVRYINNSGTSKTLRWRSEFYNDG